MLEGDTRKKKSQVKRKFKKDTGYSDVVRMREVSKGARWMPRLPEARKDVTSCEKLGVAANRR